MPDVMIGNGCTDPECTLCLEHQVAEMNAAVRKAESFIASITERPEPVEGLACGCCPKFPCPAGKFLFETRPQRALYLHLRYSYERSRTKRERKPITSR